jgi:hypothetical protein
MNERRLAITKKVSLEKLSDDWQDCYATVRPATYADYTKLVEAEPEKLAPTAQIKLEMDFVRDHFIGGKLKVFNAHGQPELVDMQPEDIELSTELTNLLFFEIVGVTPDPKGLPTATATS